MKNTRAILPLIAVLLLAAFALQPAPAHAQDQALYKGDRVLILHNTNVTCSYYPCQRSFPELESFVAPSRVVGYILNMETLAPPTDYIRIIFTGFGNAFYPPAPKHPDQLDTLTCFIFPQHISGSTTTLTDAIEFCESEGIAPENIHAPLVTDVWTNSQPAGGTVNIGVYYELNSGAASIPVRLTAIPLYLEPPPPPPLGRPLKEADELFLTNFVVEDPQNPPHRQMFPTYKSNTVYGIARGGSQRPSVHAIEEGYVIDVEPLTTEKCFVFDVDTQQCIMDWQNPDTLQLEYFSISATEMANSSIVYVQSFDSYSVATITQYVVYDVQGTLDGTQPIAQGCVLGKAIRASGGSGELSSVHVTLVRRTTDNINSAGIDLSQQLVEYPANDNPCDSGRSTCLNTDRLFENKTRWATTGRVDFAVDYPGIGAAGVIMSPGSTISQMLDLSSRTDLDVNEPMLITVSAVGRGSFTVTWGEDSETIESLTSFSSYYIQLTPGTQLAQLKVTQDTNNAGNVEISAICVSDDGFPEGFGFVSSGCYFSNPNFVDGLNGWNFSNPAGASNRFLTLGHGGSVGQEVTLYPNEDGSPHEYTFSVITSGYEGLTTSVTDVRSNLELSWGYISSCAIYYPDGSGCNPLQHQYYIPNDDLTTFEYKFEVSEATTANLFVEAYLVDTSLDPIPDTRLRVAQLCIRPEGNRFPGYERITDTVTQRLDSNGVSCNIATRDPDDDSVWRWLRNLQRFLQRYFDCTLTQRLEQITQQAFDAVALIKAGFQYVGLWGNTFLAWLDSFDNWFLSVLSNVLQTTFGGIWWALENLFAEALRFLGFAWQLIGYIFSQFAELNQRFGSIANAWEQAEPITIPGFDCSSGQDTIFCRVIWAMDNTVFVENTQFWIVLKILQATISMHWIIYMVGSVMRRIRAGRRAITDA